MNVSATTSRVGNRHHMADCIGRPSAPAAEPPLSPSRSALAQLLAEARRLQAEEDAAEAAYLSGGRTVELEEACDAASSRSHRSIKAMVRARATSIDDVMAKVAAYGLCHSEDLREHLDEEVADMRQNATDLRLLYSITRDLVEIHEKGQAAAGHPPAAATEERDPLLQFVTAWAEAEAACTAIVDDFAFDKAWENQTSPFSNAAMRGLLPPASTPAGAASALRKVLGIASLSNVERGLCKAALSYLENAA